MSATASTARILEFRPRASSPYRSAIERSAPATDLCRAKLFAQLVLCDADASLIGRTWACRSVRVSPESIEFLCERALPEGSLVDLWVDLAASPGKYYLSGRVVRTRSGTGDRFLVGVELESGAATDYDAWQAQLV